MQRMTRLHLTRRQLAGLVGITLAQTPLESCGRVSGRVRTVGVLMGLANDAEAKARIEVFEQGLTEKGWKLGQTLRIDYRFASGNDDRTHEFANQLVALRPDVIVGHSTQVTAALIQATHSIPIVFVVVSDPIGSGFVKTMARPGGNVTGFTNLEPTISGKYLSILRQIAPTVTRAAIMYNPDSATQAGEYYLPAFEEFAKKLQVTAIPAEVRSPAEIVQRMESLSGALTDGLIVMPDNFMTLNRSLIVSLCARLRVPAVYPYRYFVDDGGLMSYGVDVLDLFRRASDYVDRILRGAKPAQLPVQAPTKFELVINLKTARALGLVVPQVLLAGADALLQ